jgi:hypothetical protein
MHENLLYIALMPIEPAAVSDPLLAAFAETAAINCQVEATRAK